MDYCSSCRRTLNGALVCPGCGAYAPDIAPPAHRPDGAVASAATTVETWFPDEAVPVGSGVSEAATDGTEATADASGSASSDGFEGASATGQGRAARRRQLARWKKHRRRAVAATAVAIVGGALTVAVLPTSRPSTSHTHAGSPPEPVNTSTSTPRTANTDSSTEQPDTRGSRHPGTRPPVTTNRQQNTADATTPSATTNRQPKAAATAQPQAPLSAKPDTKPESAKGTAVDSPDTTSDAPAAPPVPAPETTAPPASTERPDDADTPLADLFPSTPTTEPTSSAHVCLIGVCVG
ncbi:hypothetical protein J7I98_38800 [Streptomyces sp. ISL-98]|uniref:SCO2400 family protein n=1 Tax=Streptomyces sp. ISL-98 TaxID=2819192 RepID=UPI001BE81172|nr:hypothetical protein [Streptomyces sp. ISL-98]MBT2511630.1 hypothetical protein [Streptomyces sp. ISL-98]